MMTGMDIVQSRCSETAAEGPMMDGLDKSVGPEMFTRNLGAHSGEWQY